MLSRKVVINHGCDERVGKETAVEEFFRGGFHTGIPGDFKNC